MKYLARKNYASRACKTAQNEARVATQKLRGEGAVAGVSVVLSSPHSRLSEVPSPQGPPCAPASALRAPTAGPHRPARCPICAGGAGLRGSPAFVGRSAAPKSCLQANLRPNLPRWPTTHPPLCALRALWRAGGRAQQGARWPPALSQRSPRTVQRLSAPSRPLLNLPLRLRCWHP